MFSQHVTKNLSAYCNSELGADESRQVAEHLIACNRCREQYEEIKLGVQLAERLPQLSAPDSVWLNIENRLAQQRTVTLGRTVGGRARLVSFSGWQPRLAWSLAAIALVVGIAVIWNRSREVRPSWAVARVSGAPRIGSAAIDGNGRLAVGQWLETDGGSRAKIDVGSIGQVEIDPNTAHPTGGNKTD